MPGSKQGPVRLTMVPPSMFPFSGANTKGRFAPIRSLKHFVIFRFGILILPDAHSWQDLLVDPEYVSAGEPIGHPCVGQVPNVGGLRERLLTHYTKTTFPNTWLPESMACKHKTLSRCQRWIRQRLVLLPELQFNSILNIADLYIEYIALDDWIF